jgi:hypothetical protein
VDVSVGVAVSGSGSVEVEGASVGTAVASSNEGVTPSEAIVEATVDVTVTNVGVVVSWSSRVSGPLHATMLPRRSIANAAGHKRGNMRFIARNATGWRTARWADPIARSDVRRE